MEYKDIKTIIFLFIILIIFSIITIYFGIDPIPNCPNCTMVSFICFGLIVGLEGGMGSGKTIMMVRYLLKDFANGHKVFVNFGLRHIDYEFLNIHDLMEDNDLQNMSVGIDEITVFLDCRKSSSKMNRYISYFILQTRKRNVNLYYTTQSFRMIDKRLLEHTEFQIICEKCYNEHGNEIDGLRHYSIIDLRDITDVRNIKIKRFKIDITPYYDFYDTNEVILPPI